MSRADIANVTPEQLQQALDEMATGKYRKGAVFAALGFTWQACYMREARDPEFAAQVEQAMAIGEKRICDDLHDALTGVTPGDWRGFELILRRIHRITDPLDEQRIIESKAQTKALEKAASDPVAAAADEAQWKEAAATLGLGVIAPQKTPPPEGEAK